MRRQTTFLLLLVTGVTLEALSALGLASAQVAGGGGMKEDKGKNNDFLVIVDDAVATPTPLSSNDVVELSSLPRRESTLQVSEIDTIVVDEDDAKARKPCSWNDVKLSLPRHDPLDDAGKKKKRQEETCPVAGLVAQCPPHKHDIQYENYTMRTYYGGEKEERREGREQVSPSFFTSSLRKK